jgi:hypothetical protein
MSFTQFLSSHVGGSKSRSESEFRPWPKIAIDCITDIDYIANPEVINKISERQVEGCLYRAG